MTKLHLALALCALAFTSLASRPAHAGGAAEVHDKYIQIGSINYFRTGADRVQLGSYGEKKSPVTQGNYLEVQANLPGGKLKKYVKSASIVSIDFTKSSKTDVEAGLSGVSVANGGGSVSYEKLRSGSLKLVHLIVLPGDMATAVNGTSGALSALKGYGKDARVAHEIFIVLEASVAESFVSSTSFEVTVPTQGGLVIKGSTSNESAGTTSVTLSAGTTFAYLLVKADWNDSKTKIDKFTDDQWGMN